MTAVLVESGGLFTTLQARSRTGCAHLGVGPAGALDTVAARLANWLVGNDGDAALLEFSLRGPRLRIDCDGWLALTGGEFQATVDGHRVPSKRPLWVRAGSSFDCGAVLSGARGYLALAGGLVAAERLGSGATARGFGGLPGHEGRALKAGDTLQIKTAPQTLFPSLASRLADFSGPFFAAPWTLGWPTQPTGEQPLRFLPGPDFEQLSPSEQRLLYERELRIGRDCDRMGLRLQHPDAPVAFVGKAAADRPSAGVATGAVQLLPSGELVVLLADRQTTGGYPLLGCVATVDHGRLAQGKPGEPLRFVKTTLAEAQTAYLRREQALSRLHLALKEKAAR